MRVCGYCKGELVWKSGSEQSARERAGNAREVDTFTCQGCERRFRHVVRESFSGDSHWWGEWNGETFATLEESSWPGFG